MKRICFFIILVAFTAAASAQQMPVNKPLWDYQLEGRVNAATADNQSIYAGDESGVYQIGYAKNLNWYHETSSAITALDLDGDLFSSTADGRIMLISPAGDLMWERDIPGYVGFPNALDKDNSLLFAGSMDGFVYMFDNEGIYQWKRLIGSYVKRVYVGDDTLIGVSDRQVYLMDKNGKVKRNLNISGQILASYVGDSIIALGLEKNTLSIYNMSGTLLWAKTLKSEIKAISITPNITVATQEGKVARFDRLGNIEWETNMSSTPVSLNSFESGVQVGLQNNKVVLLNRYGIIRWSNDVDGRPHILAENGANLITATTGGRIYYSKLPTKDITTSFAVAFTIVVFIIIALIMVYRSW